MRITEGDRSAAMQLGISTVVILVIAMVMIGAGISFIRTIFSSGEQVISKSVPSEDLTLDATASDPLDVSKTQLRAQQGTSTSVQIGVYNYKNDKVNVTTYLSECKNATDQDYTDFNIVSTEKTIETGTTGGWNILFNLPDDASAQSPFVCKLQANATKEGTTGNVFTRSTDLIIRATG
jgi:hypothetical protein